MIFGYGICMSEAPLERVPWYRRIELVSLVHLTFFVLAVMSPSLITQNYGGIPQQHLEEIFIFAFGLAGLMTSGVHQRLVEQRTNERDVARSTADRAKGELIESYKYIGSVNRQIEVLKQFANKTSISLLRDDAYWKELLTSLAANAAASANAQSVLIRFLDIDTLRTDREIAHDLNKHTMTFRVANKELKRLHDFGSQHAFMRTDDGHEILAVPSDRKQGGVKAFLLLATDPSRTGDSEASIVKVFANQAELIYHQLAKKKEIATQDAAAAIDAITQKMIGEIS